MDHKPTMTLEDKMFADEIPPDVKITPRGPTFAEYSKAVGGVDSQVFDIPLHDGRDHAVLVFFKMHDRRTGGNRVEARLVARIAGANGVYPLIVCHPTPSHPGFDVRVAGGSEYGIREETGGDYVRRLRMDSSGVSIRDADTGKALPTIGGSAIRFIVRRAAFDVSRVLTRQYDAVLNDAWDMEIECCVVPGVGAGESDKSPEALRVTILSEWEKAWEGKGGHAPAVVEEPAESGVSK